MWLDFLNKDSNTTDKTKVFPRHSLVSNEILEFGESGEILKIRSTIFIYSAHIEGTSKEVERGIYDKPYDFDDAFKALNVGVVELRVKTHFSDKAFRGKFKMVKALQGFPDIATLQDDSNRGRTINNQTLTLTFESVELYKDE